MKKKFILCLASLCLTAVCLGQTIPKNKTFLKIGDRMPDINFKTIYNYPAKSLHLASLKDKLVILDFWGSACATCLAKFQHLMDVQTANPEKLQIILANIYESDNPEKINKLFKRLEYNTGRKITLPYLLQAINLKGLFYFQTIPHLVWLRHGRVVAITESDHVNDGTINHILQNAGIPPVKDDHELYSETNNLLVNNVGGSPDNFIFRSVITPYCENLGGGGGVVRDSNLLITKFYQMNSPLWELLGMVHPKVFNNTAYKTVNESGIDLDRRFSYEVVLPPSNMTQVLNIVQQDIDRYFRLKVENGYREIDALQLKGILRVKGFDAPEDTLQITPQAFAIMLQDKVNIPVLVDSIHTDVMFRMPLRFNLLSVTDLKEILARKGYELVAVRKKLPVILVSKTAD